MKPKVLLLTSELFPEFGYPTAGGGVRAQQIFNSLRAEGFPVQLGLAREAALGKSLPDWATSFLYRPEFLDGLVESADPDVVLSESWEPLTHLRHEERRLYVADCPGPLILENLLVGLTDLREATFHKVRALSRLDAVICANHPMRFYLSGFLTLAGWSPGQCDRIRVAPIALPDSLPNRQPVQGSEFSLFVGGISWAWHSSSEWLLRLADELERRGIGRLRIRTGRHPHHDRSAASFEEIDSRLLNHPRVSLEGLTSWDTLINELASTALAIEWSPLNLEREIASTLRIVTNLWCGVPVIVRPHLEIAREIAEYEAGWVIEDWEAMAQLVDDLSRDPAEVQRRSRQAQRLAKDKHAWPTAHSGLVNLLDSLSPREKGPSFLQHATDAFRTQEEEIHRLRGENKFLHEETSILRDRTRVCEQDAESFRALRQKLPYKVWKRIVG